MAWLGGDVGILFCELSELDCGGGESDLSMGGSFRGFRGVDLVGRETGENLSSRSKSEGVEEAGVVLTGLKSRGD